MLRAGLASPLRTLLSTSYLTCLSVANAQIYLGARGCQESLLRLVSMNLLDDIMLVSLPKLLSLMASLLQSHNLTIELQ